MNALFNTALKQSASLKHDLELPQSGQQLTPSFLGQVSASLTAFSRTIESFSNLVSSELNPSKKEKAEERLKNFRAELVSFREELKELKLQNEEVQSNINRAELLSRRPHNYSSTISDNPYSNISISANTKDDSQWAPKAHGGPLSMGSGDYVRETHALREQNFMAETNSTLDDYLARGQAVLGDLNQQREMLKGTQKRLYSVANTLGISGEAIRMIERRTKQDKWMFYACAIIFFGFCWAVLHFLR